MRAGLMTSRDPETTPATRVSYAAELGVSVKTVSTYRTRIFEKLSIDNNADLTMYCIRNKLISND